MPVDVRSKAALLREHARTETGDRDEERRQPVKNQITSHNARPCAPVGMKHHKGGKEVTQANVRQDPSHEWPMCKIEKPARDRA